MSSELSYRALLPITIVAGMRVHNWRDDSTGTIVGICMDYCVYRLEQSDELWVGNWRDLAVGGQCPARQLLPTDITENDKRNASRQSSVGRASFGVILARMDCQATKALIDFRRCVVASA